MPPLITRFTTTTSTIRTIHRHHHPKKRSSSKTAQLTIRNSNDDNKNKKNNKERNGNWIVSISPIGRKVKSEVEKVRENLSPKQKGDWKDVVLMGLSFAVYIYISQKIVRAYCSWIAIHNHHQ